MQEQLGKLTVGQCFVWGADYYVLVDTVKTVAVRINRPAGSGPLPGPDQYTFPGNSVVRVVSSDLLKEHFGERLEQIAKRFPALKG